jgi:2-C-methyl-D-erythritol 4-phosphate cytidylyltransferase
MSVIVLVPAAGTGSRMGAAVNKQYLVLAGRPILAHTLSLFDRHPAVDHIYAISPAEEIPFCQTEVVERFGFQKVREVVAGGAERQESVYNGLSACGADPDDIVLIHDGVRPFFPGELIAPVVAAAARHGGCVVGVPVKDTIKRVEDGLIRETPDRRLLWQAQTPQAFRYASIMAAHRQARSESFRGTDDASLLERLGLPVAMLQGSYRNIKITTPEDLQVARAFLGLESPCDNH